MASDALSVAEDRAPGGPWPTVCPLMGHLSGNWLVAEEVLGRSRPQAVDRKGNQPEHLPFREAIIPTRLPGAPGAEKDIPC